MLLTQEMDHKLSQMKNIKPVVLQKLRHLTVTSGLMQNFFNRFIQIDLANLHTFIFQGDNDDNLQNNGHNNSYVDARDLIARHKNLRMLRFEVTNEFFYRPLIINCQLRKLYVDSNRRCE